MAAFYVEASAIVKHYRSEVGSNVVRELLTAPPVADRFHTSLLSTVEVTSATYRQTRTGRIQDRWAQQAMAHFRATVAGHFRIWPLGDGTMATAVVVAEQHRLRAGDAIHLATASGVAALAPQQPLVLVSSDGELLQAAAAAGLAALDPAAPDAVARLRELRA